MLALHSTHDEPASEYVPARQFTQAVETVDPDGEDLPAAQLEHDDPATEYVPAAQATQAVDPDCEDVNLIGFVHLIGFVNLLEFENKKSNPSK